MIHICYNLHCFFFFKAEDGIRVLTVTGVQTCALPIFVDKSCRLASAEELWKRDKIEEALISLPPYEAIPKHFQQGLTRLGIDWFPRIEVSSLALIETYVESGYGIGLSVAIPRSKPSARIRVIRLDAFA